MKTPKHYMCMLLLKKQIILGVFPNDKATLSDPKLIIVKNYAYKSKEIKTSDGFLLIKKVKKYSDQCQYLKMFLHLVGLLKNLKGVNRERNWNLYLQILKVILVFLLTE